MKYRRNSDADLRDLERRWESSRSEEDLRLLNIARTRAGLPIYHDLKLTWGYQEGLPPEAPAAYGARAILASRANTIDTPPDRACLVGDDHHRELLRALLNDGILHDMRQNISRLVRRYVINREEDKEHIVYDDLEVRIVCNTRASHGYLYITAFLKAPGAVYAPITVACEGCNETFVNQQDLVECHSCAKLLCVACSDQCDYCDVFVCKNWHDIKCSNCEAFICTSDACERTRRSAECQQCGRLYCFDCRQHSKHCPCEDEICQHCEDEIETCPECENERCSCSPCPCQEEEAEEENEEEEEESDEDEDEDEDY